MLSVDYIRKNPQKVKDAARNKNRQVDIDLILKLDEQRRNVIQEIQTLREQRNASSHQKPDQETIQKNKKLKETLKQAEQKLRAIESELNTLLLFVPNIPLAEVPIGKDASQNKVVRTVGTIPQFNFTPRSHLEIGEALDLLDLERGTKVAGFRGYFLKNQLAVLHLALLFYSFQKLVKKGYTPLVAPAIVKNFALVGSAHFPWGKEQDVYKLNEEDAYLAATAEVATTAYYAGETLAQKQLPKKFVAISPCFRREAGAYGKDTKGLYRVHEFLKTEQVILSENNIDKAREIHEELQTNAEEILKDLRLPYRVLLMCTGDMGEPQLKKYDTETWMPSRKNYGETMSNSIMGDFQTRRLNIKYKTPEGKSEYCFSYNNTALASPRILIAILENYQQENGSVKVPTVLQSLAGFSEIKK
ncbi:serine--tRNA ligase [Candidatus Roizmanbacteria bacterium]|nr:serine--tRNA ligase [Candidatus Roizmanbacteria bacterium]